MIKNKLVSIAMTTYNGEKYIQKQLESILNQTYSILEIIICDDMSKDRTVEIIKEYAKKDSRIKLYINEKNLGFKKNFERVISLCSGSYIALADQDDIWKKNKIKKLVENIGQYDLIHSTASLIDENSNVINEKWIKQDDFKYTFERFIFGNTVTGCTLLFKRQLLEDFFPIPSGEKYHDWWLGLLASKHKGIKYIDIPLIKYRQHNEQDTGANVKTLFSRIIGYLNGILSKKESNRYKRAVSQIRRLESFLNEKNEIFSNKELLIIEDAVKYYENYINSFFHIHAFIISIKYDIYHKNRFFVKNITRDLIG